MEFSCTGNTREAREDVEREERRGRRMMGCRTVRLSLKRLCFEDGSSNHGKEWGIERM